MKTSARFADKCACVGQLVSAQDLLLKETSDAHP